MILDAKTTKLDLEILKFIKDFGQDPAPDDLFQTLALKIYEYQFMRNLNYRKFCLQENKRPGELKSWKEIPAMPADGFKELVLTTFPRKNAVKIFKTSGSTGKKRGFHFFDTLRLYEESVQTPFQRFLIPDGGDFSYCFLTNSPKEAPDSSLSHMMGVVNRVWAKKRGAFYVPKDEVLHDRLCSDLKSAKKQVFLLATAFALKSFLNHLRENKILIQLPKGSRLMETGGFKGRVQQISKESLYQECEKRLGIAKDHCVSEYGMTELSSQFYDTTLWDKMNGVRREPFKLGPAWLKTLAIDPKTGREVAKGQPGILRHFDLANRGSVLAIQTDDLGKQAGDGFELLGRASGSELRGCSLDYETLLRA